LPFVALFAAFELTQLGSGHSPASRLGLSVQLAVVGTGGVPSVILP
jgi:hypothetical protein